MDKEAGVALSVVNELQPPSDDMFYCPHFTDKIWLTALSHTQKKYIFIYFVISFHFETFLHHNLATAPLHM